MPPPSFSDMVPFYKQVLGFTMELKTVSNFKISGLLQPWQTICKIFSKCLTTRVTGWDQSPLQIMQMLYCFVNNIHVDYAELMWEGIYYSLHHPATSIPYPRFTKIIISHYMTIFPDISRRARDAYHNLQDDDIMKNIFNSGRNKNKVGMRIPAWMITDEMKLTEHYKMYAEVFGLDVPLTQSQPTESTQGTHRTPSAPRSPNPATETAESSVPKFWLCFCFFVLFYVVSAFLDGSQMRYKLRSHYKMYAEVLGLGSSSDSSQPTEEVYPGKHIRTLLAALRSPNTEKAVDVRILQDMIQVSLAEHKSHEEQEARENVALDDDTSIPGTRDNMMSMMANADSSLVKEKVTEQVKKEVLVQVRDQVPVYLAEGLILERKTTKEETERLISKAILQERGHIAIGWPPQVKFKKTQCKRQKESEYEADVSEESRSRKLMLSVHQGVSVIWEIDRAPSKKEKRVMRHSEIHKFCDATLRRTLEGLKSYYNDVKYGYVQKELTNDEVEFLKLFEEEIEVRLNYRDQMRKMGDYISFLHVFGALYYPKNDREDIGKLGAKGDIDFFIGYFADSCTYRFKTWASKHDFWTDQFRTRSYLCSVNNNNSTTNYKVDLDFKFERMRYDDHFGGQPPAAHDHPLEQVIGEPSRPVLIKNQLRSNGDMCMYALTVMDIQEKDKNQSQNDKTEHENRKSVKEKSSQSQKSTKSQRTNVNPENRFGKNIEQKP
ncbi:hypothetical protein Tco_0660497 [Tanacetum coccineum]